MNYFILNVYRKNIQHLTKMLLNNKIELFKVKYILFRKDSKIYKYTIL